MSRTAAASILRASIDLTWLCAAADVRRTDCFPIERLPAQLQDRFASQMLGALYRDYLYTLVGGLKPISDGGAIGPVGVEFAYPDLSGVTELHQLLPAWQ